MFHPAPIDLHKQTQALTMLRWLTAILIGIHGWYRLLSGGAILFGQYLNETGWPFGSLIAWAITLFECGGMIALFVNRFVVPVCLAELFILVMGVYLVHAPSGWFVVGAGRNGVEYSILLIGCLCLFVYLNWPPKRIFTDNKKAA